MIEDNKGAVILNALVGIAGLAITVKAIENNSEVLLANKESLVIGGDLIKNYWLNIQKLQFFQLIVNILRCKNWFAVKKNR